MAEFVQQSIEEMLPELEQMQRVGLFSKEEIRKILSRRQDYEYKLRRRTKCKEDYLRYIEYETNVLKLVKQRREKIGYTFKRLEIDVAIVKRIHKLFQLVCQRFQSDVKLWLTHIDFAKSRREKSKVGKIFTRMLQIHSKKPELWIMAANWEAENNDNMENARSVLHRALRNNPQSQKIMLEHYKLELLYSKKVREKMKNLGQDFSEAFDSDTQAAVQGAVADVIYKNAMQECPDDVDFLLAFLPICKSFDFTNEAEEKIYNDLQEHFPDKPQTWDAIARRHLSHCQKDTNADTAIHEDLCFQVYGDALKRINTNAMWSLYLEACLEVILWSAPVHLREKRIRRALTAFKQASLERQVSVTLYQKWLELLTNTGLVDEGIRVTELAVNHHPKSPNLWVQRLHTLINTLAPFQQVTETFQAACRTVPVQETWPLWRTLFTYLLTCDGKEDELVEHLQQAVKSIKPVCEPAKQFYLQWMYLHGGISKLRKLYDKLSQLKPVSLEFYRTYLKMESAQPKPKIKILRRVYEEAILEYGDSDSDLWLEYIQTELQHPKGQPEKASQLQFRAVKTLQGTLNDQFVTKYTLLQTGKL